MDLYQKHEIFEIEVLEKLKNNRFLESLAFGGGTMLRLCHELPRYSAELDFWIVKDIKYNPYFNRLRQFVNQSFELTNSQIKHHTLLYEFRSGDYPRRLKIEIRKKISDCDFQDKIAFSRYSNKQVILKTMTLGQMLKNKIEAILERKEIRDAFDIEFLLRRGIPFPELPVKTFSQLLHLIEGFSEREFKVTLGSVLEPDIREYYVTHRFSYLLEKLSLKLG
ncbi:MAG: nucleotidyl transferase AbiEii/AbiGii toxin family protein [bacterium]|nr:MAG: nucleotidyl transferase AbiEii/AbiGii toxin family protein [bacterium]